MHILSIKTGGKTDFLDITGKVQDAVRADSINSGVCHVFVPHTTAGVTINEHADPAVMKDIAAWLDGLAPEGGNYRHMEGNSPGHIKATVTGSSVTVFIAVSYTHLRAHET